MLKAYVGVASPHGLAVLQPERADTLWLVESWAGRGRRVGFWAVLGDADADGIQTLFRNGYRREALLMLDRWRKTWAASFPATSSTPHSTDPRAMT